MTPTLVMWNLTAVRTWRHAKKCFKNYRMVKTELIKFTSTSKIMWKQSWAKIWSHIGSDAHLDTGDMKTEVNCDSFQKGMTRLHLPPFLKSALKMDEYQFQMGEL